VLVTLLALAPVACALAPVSGPEEPAPLLWRAQPVDGRGPLFLLGSVHLGTPETLEMGDAVREAWSRADELVVEVDLSSVSPEAAAATTLRYGTLPPDQTLEDVVGRETWQRLAESLEASGVPAAGFARYKPWMAATALVVLQLQAAGLEARYGVDQHLIGEAAGRTPIVGLESFESQLATLDSLPPEVQTLMLRDALDRADPSADGAARLIEAWRRGDEEALVEEFFGAREQTPELETLYRKLYFERNEVMSARLAELSRDGKTRLAVIGAGHLVGPRGIPALLRQRGFRVERYRGP
jgi:uncharacterized protein YbaP (TraB family)